MLLVDTSVWIDHLRRPDMRLVDALEAGLVVAHPLVTGELACGDLRNRASILSLLNRLGQSTVGRIEDAHVLIERHQLMGRGIGIVDVLLLTSAAIDGTRLWTHDRRLRAVADDLGLSA